jgi:LPXTG-motif cell wall-anchored protein
MVAAIAAGILALGGGAFLFTRRRRRDEDSDYVESVYDEPIVEPVAAAPPEFAPAFFAGTSEDAALAPDRPLADLPEDFDESRFGRHVQAAYRGPTADNPSLSLKTRLKRARFFDERDRKAGMQSVPTHASAEEMIAHARAAREAHDEEKPVFWPHDRKDAETKPAFQS